MGASPSLRAQLQTMAVDNTVSLHASADAAKAAFAQQPARIRTVVPLMPVVRSARTAREVTGRFYTGWGPDQLSDNVALIASELVANAVRHANTELELSISLRRHLRLGVRDYSALLPERRVGAEREGGRGLLIVDKLATSWGCTVLFDGKVVWALVRLP